MATIRIPCVQLLRDTACSIFRDQKKPNWQPSSVAFQNEQSFGQVFILQYFPEKDDRDHDQVDLICLLQLIHHLSFTQKGSGLAPFRHFNSCVCCSISFIKVLLIQGVRPFIRSIISYKSNLSSLVLKNN